MLVTLLNFLSKATKGAQCDCTFSQASQSCRAVYADVCDSEYPNTGYTTSNFCDELFCLGQSETICGTVSSECTDLKPCKCSGVQCGQSSIDYCASGDCWRICELAQAQLDNLYGDSQLCSGFSDLGTSCPQVSETAASEVSKYCTCPPSGSSCGISFNTCTDTTLCDRYCELKHITGDCVGYQFNSESFIQCSDIESHISQNGMCTCSTGGDDTCQVVTDACSPGLCQQYCAHQGNEMTCPAVPPTSNYKTCAEIQSIVDNPGGIGDPHFTGFDSSKYDFHGSHNRNYIIFAQKNGDLLTAKMRATPELLNSINKTYMSEFGIQVSKSTDKIHFFVRREEGRTGNHFIVRLTVNGRNISEDERNRNYKIMFSSKISIAVLTQKTTFLVKGVSLNSLYRRHMDIQVVRRVKKLHDERFTGIVGRTIHHGDKALVRKSELKFWDRYIDFEKHLRKVFEVDSLFPRQNDHMELYLNSSLKANSGFVKTP